MWKRKPKQWIERIPLRCKDELHDFLMREFGFQKYCEQKLWRLKLNDIKPHASLSLEFETQKAIEAELGGEPIPTSFTEAILSWHFQKFQMEMVPPVEFPCQYQQERFNKDG